MDTKRKPGRPKNPDGQMIQKSIRMSASEWKEVETAANRLGWSQSRVIVECAKVSAHLVGNACVSTPCSIAGTLLIN